MTYPMQPHGNLAHAQSHDHVFPGAAHETNEPKTWAISIVCAMVMLVGIAGDRARPSSFECLSHLTVEVIRAVAS